MEGNLQAEKKIRLTKRLLGLAGIGEERLHLEWVSSAEAQRFVEITKQVTDSVKNQGKFNPQAFTHELDAAKVTLSGETIRWLVGKELKITSDGDVYGRKWDKDSFESILDSTLEREYQMHLIYQVIKDGCRSVRDINAKTGLELTRISYLMADMEKRNMVEFTGMEDSKPVFEAL
ncbi:MAG: hydrogenase iron-sulfur subunit [Desulfobacterales bacterium]|nr:hydrogenase iron-sulfur subunit [Desulfobacterales bacterium]